MLSKPKHADFKPPNAYWWLVGIVAALNLLAYLIGFWWVMDSREDYQERARIESRNISRVLAQSIAHAFDKVELVLLDAQEELSHQIKEGTIDNRAMAPYLASLQMRVPELKSLRATDAEGTLIYGQGVPTDPPTSVSDDSHFPYLRDNPNAGTSIASPKFGILNQTWVIKISRRYDKADGSFGGVINGAIDLEQLIALVPELDVGPYGVISLRDGDLGIIFRIPAPGIGKDIGQRIVTPELRQGVQKTQTSGSYLAISPNDGIERVYAFQKVGKWNLYLNVGLATQDYLVKWRQELRLAIMAESVFTFFSALLVLLFYRYIRAHSLYEAKLREQQEVFRSLAEISSDWFWEQDSDYRFTHMSRDLSYQTHSDFGSVVGKMRWEIAVEPGEEEWARHRAALEAHEPFHDFEYSFIDAYGKKRAVSSSGSPIFDSGGKFVGYRGTSKDVTERHEYEARIQNMAQYDNLTEIPNRALFYDRLHQAISIARRNQHRFALLYLDLDKFKPVNDTYGHDTGDRLLKAVAQRLMSVLRESDTLARLGGDEFAIIMPHIDSMSDPAAVAEKVIGVIVEPFYLEGVDAELAVGVSIGIAVFPEDADTSDDLIKSADHTMYCAKKYGNAYRYVAECKAIGLAPEPQLGEAGSDGSVQVSGPDVVA